jgi:hypothetical protein
VKVLIALTIQLAFVRLEGYRSTQQLPTRTANNSSRTENRKRKSKKNPQRASLFSVFEKKTNWAVIGMEGWLEKQGHMFKTWKKRWVVLEQQDETCFTLSYFIDETKREKKGEFRIALDSAVTNLDDGYSSGKANMFVLQAEGHGKTFLMMSAATEAEKNAWIVTIDQAIDRLRHHAESHWQA